ncbi:efflux RND transporter periplasmic adaptor subunit [Thalassoroseus pseudoceratinae]|uniref:efflux RND transporter periplasmic adaptor subunit n=1 Tax=Thalassoroseus pseudoceratinae TaxID=2713176 RepID=UPI0014219B93|nr:efflux RND transporter periplasmic adaptor subunit [Thalassoroseus pseudoceratinae]
MHERLRMACVLLAVAVHAGCGETETTTEPVRPVRAIKVGDLKSIGGREFPGRASAKNEVELSFQVAGLLASLPVDVGSDVNKGDVIGTLDPRDFETALASAQATLAQARANLTAMETGARPEELEQLKATVSEAEATYKQALVDYQRTEKLFARGAATQQEIDVAVARRDRTSAQLVKAKEDLNIGMKGAREEDLEAKRSEIRALEAAVANAKNQLQYTVLKAPFDGEIAARYVDNFQTVVEKQPVVRLLDVATIEVTIQIPESIIPLVPLVKQVSCFFDVFGDREFVGRVTKVGSEASRTTRTYPVTIEIDQPEDVRILPGMAAKVRNKPDENEVVEEAGLIVPPSAVSAGEDGQKSFVWVVSEADKTVTRREVELGELTPVGLSVSKGLKRGEWVVTAGVNTLRENQQVKIFQDGGR